MPELKSNKNLKLDSKSGDQEVTLYKPQAHALVGFLPSMLPHMQRTPPMLERGFAVSTSLYVDLFMSDLVQVVPIILQALISPPTPTASVGQQHTFSQPILRVEASAARG